MDQAWLGALDGRSNSTIFLDAILIQVLRMPQNYLALLVRDVEVSWLRQSSV